MIEEKRRYDLDWLRVIANTSSVSTSYWNAI